MGQHPPSSKNEKWDTYDPAGARVDASTAPETADGVTLSKTSVSFDSFLANYSSGSLGSYISGLGPAVGLAVAAAIVVFGKIIALDKLVR